MEYRLRYNAETAHSCGRDLYEEYGAAVQVSGEHGQPEDVQIQVVEYDWLDESNDRTVARKLLHFGEMAKIMTMDDALAVVARAREVRDAMDYLEELMDDAVDAYNHGDLKKTMSALEEAVEYESKHGGSPATADLTDALLEEKEDLSEYWEDDGPRRALVFTRNDDD